MDMPLPLFYLIKFLFFLARTEHSPNIVRAIFQIWVFILRPPFGLILHTVIRNNITLNISGIVATTLYHGDHFYREGGKDLLQIQHPHNFRCFKLVPL